MRTTPKDHWRTLIDFDQNIWDISDMLESDGRLNPTTRFSASVGERDEKVLAPARYRPEDILFTVVPRLVIAHRVREYLESVAPEHCWYYPVDIRWPTECGAMPEYWLTHWRHRVDCWDRSHSRTRRCDDDASCVDISLYVIDASRVPDNLQIFLGHGDFNLIIVTNDLRKHIEQQRFHFISFQRMWTTQEWLDEGQALMGTPSRMQQPPEAGADATE